MRKLWMVLGVAGLLLVCTAVAVAGIHGAQRHHGNAERLRPTPPPDVPPAVNLINHGMRVSLPWSDDLESGGVDWTVSGFFHTQANPQTFMVLNPTINPRLVTLPDDGHLPAAHSGNHDLWYGQECTGTFVGCDFDQNQPELSGGTSSGPNTGWAITPELDLAGISTAYLTFWTWWEIEGVDVNTYDMMYVEISTDAGATWNPLGTLNPLDDVNANPNVGYSSGGVGAPGVWQEQQFDLSAFSGGSAWVRFRFDTRDQLYNGFRGWFVDDVQVFSGTNPAPTITDVIPGTGQAGDLVTVTGTGFQNGAQITVGGMATLESIQSSTHAQVIIPALPGPGAYDVQLTNPDGQFATCVGCFEITSNPGPEIDFVDPDHQQQGAGIAVTISGHYFAAGASVLFGGVPATNIVVVNNTTITATTPDFLPLGFHAVQVQNPDGQFDLCVGCFQVTASPCQFPYEQVDMGDLTECSYPTLDNNPGHALTGVAWLGPCVNGEEHPHVAQGPLRDLCTDEEPAHLDGCEDGVAFFGVPWTPCTMVSVLVQVTSGPNYQAYLDCGGQLYLSGWKDGNMDGDFDDELCDGEAPEWIIHDEVVTPGIHLFTFRDPGVFNIGVYDGIFRFRLTHQPVGQYGYGLLTTACPGMEHGSFGFDEVLGEVEDYVMCDLQLAVELAAFDVIPANNSVQLRWSTASETQNDHFEIVRDGMTVAQLPTQGNGATGHSYTYNDNTAQNGTLYHYTLVAVDVNGGRQELRSASATPSANAVAQITAYALSQNYPNPFNPTTSIGFDLVESGHVSLTVYNLMGQQVAMLVNGTMAAGRHTVSFNASSLPSGVYLYRIEANGFSAEKKMLLMK